MQSKEDYLRVMYKLNENKNNIRLTDIAKELRISKPSVSEMIRKLKKLKLINVEPYSDITLTKKGLSESKRITHNHRVIEVFLKKILGYNDKSIHDEAHKLEHALSEESIKRLDEFLNNPKICPHGSVIPHE